MKRIVLFCLLAACGDDDAPELTSITCTPAQLSVSATPPHEVTCAVKFEGKVGDLRGTASTGGVMWASASEILSDTESSSGQFSLTFSSSARPTVGELAISVTGEHPAGIDGPPESTIETTIEVVP